MYDTEKLTQLMKMGVRVILRWDPQRNQYSASIMELHDTGMIETWGETPLGALAYALDCFVEGVRHDGN